MADLLDRVDAAIDGRCPCGAEPREGSAYCSTDCEPTHISTDTGRSEMRWRPDLLVAFDESGLELLREQTGRRGFTYRWYRHEDSRRFLRVDDGCRWVGAFSDLREGLRVDLWRRLERELTDTRQLDGEPAGATAPGYFQIRTDFGCVAYDFAVDGVMELIRRWIHANGVDWGMVVAYSDLHEIAGGRLRLECYARNEDGRFLLDETGRDVRTEIREVPLLEPLP